MSTTRHTTLSKARRAAQRTIAVGAILFIGGVSAAVPSLAQDTGAEEEIRTEVPDLGGFTAKAVSSPISVLMFEPVIPVPAGPGEPHGEMHGSYSRATLSTGPASRGLASSLWPGPTAGDGLGAFDENLFYPIRASATYPDGPFEDYNSGDENTGTGMFAYAKGIDVYGESNGGGELIPGLLSVGNMKSVSTTTVVDGVVIAETIATASDIEIAGMITIDSMQTRLLSRSNGDTAETDGVYEISGIEVMGQGYEFTEDGIVATGPEGEALTIPLGIGNEIDLRDAIGISFETAPINEDLDGASGTRSTRGVLITIDTTPLREAAGFLPLADVIGSIPDPGVDVVPCDQLPPEMSALPCFSNPVSGLKANLFTLASLQPEIRFLLGGAEVSSSASLPFSFTPPALPALPPAPSSTTTSVSTPTFTSPPAPTPTTAQPEPVVASGPTSTPAPQVVALPIPDNLSTGLGAGAVLTALLGAGVMALGASKLTEAVLSTTAAPAAVGAGQVPDLRAFAQGG